jgi:hypothetical protein
MQIKPLKQTGGRRVANAMPFASPVGGWNARDSLTDMAPHDALELVNWFPRQNDCVIRRGYTQIQDLGTSRPVDTMVPYFRGSTKVLIAASDGKLFNANSGALLGTGYASNYWLGVSLGPRMVLVNGADAPLTFDGAALAAHTFTDATGTLNFADLNFVHTFKSRLFFIEKGTQSFWYGTTQATGGALAEFDLSLVGNFAGELKIITSLTNDGGDGKDDLFVAIFSEGDVVVYQGSDPGLASEWDHVGTYKIGEPLSRFAHATNGADVLIATTRGYEQLIRSSRDGEGVRVRDLVSDKIQREVNARVSRYGASDDWALTLYNRGQMLIATAPVTNSSARHHVRNINTGAWTRFDLPAVKSFAIIDKECFVGTRDGKVCRFDDGETDAGAQIGTSATLAWNPFKNRTIQKFLQLIKLNFTGVFFPTVRVSVAADFKKHLRFTTLNVGPQAAPAYWNEDHWDAAYWSSGVVTREFWHKHSVHGYYISVRIETTGHQGELGWNAITYIESMGGLV